MTAKLEDTVVEKLGLVTVGANQEQFFLLKSAPDAGEPVVNTADNNELVETVTKSVWAKLVDFFKAKDAKPEDAMSDEEQSMADDEEDELEKKKKAVCKDDSDIAKVASATNDKATDPVANIISEEPQMSDVNVEMVAKAQYDLLAGTVDDLKTRLAKAESIAEAARDASALQDAIAKAGALEALPINPSELGTNMHKLAKSDPQLALYFDAVLKAADKLLLDLGIYGERGITTGNDTDPVMKAAQSANPREAMLSLNRRDAAEYLAKRQAATGGRRM
jgi:hypothetical protein